MDEYELVSAESKGSAWHFCWETSDGVKLEQSLDKETLEELATKRKITIEEAAYAFIEDSIELHQQDQAMAEATPGAVAAAA